MSCCLASKNLENTRADWGVQSERLLVGDGAFDLGFYGIELAASPQRGLVRISHPGGEDPIDLGGHRDALDECRFARSRRVGMDAEFVGHAEILGHRGPLLR